MSQRPHQRMGRGLSPMGPCSALGHQPQDLVPGLGLRPRQRSSRRRRRRVQHKRSSSRLYKMSDAEVEDFLLRVGFDHEKRMTMQACGMCMDIFCSRA
ncbi:hypothetical protein CUMW_166150 [Citrus unshiu]|uniref:Uncharacterized protein n=1 Tax=Citrus unshiu TaxID=55188 RepID=A0A2H5PTJ7_CITUN|nr:hypothetical protein CUMW_166150 [Citrus unshiu]